MNINLNTADSLSNLDRQILTLLIGGPVPVEAKAPAKKAPAKPAKDVEPEPEPEPEGTDDGEKTPGDEPTEGDGDGAVTQQAVVDAATALVTAGKSAVVKKALAAVEARRVSEVKESDYARFLELLG